MRFFSAWVGLGANLAEPLAQLRAARRTLQAIPDTILLATAPLYSSSPIGPTDQPDYLNSVVQLATRQTPHQLLASLQAIESSQGRTRERHWGPRTLDLDLLLYAADTIATPELTVPHPEITLRAFVLYPLLALQPRLCLPSGVTLATCLPAVAGQSLHRCRPRQWW